MRLADVVDTLTVDPALLLIVVGSVTFLITFFGCIGALRNATCLLKMVRRRRGEQEGSGRGRDTLTGLCSPVPGDPDGRRPPADHSSSCGIRLHRRGENLSDQRFHWNVTLAGTNVCVCA